MLALTFADPADYDRLRGTDKLSILGLKDGGFRPGVPLVIRVTPASGPAFDIKANHTFNAQQIEWFKAGSALNFMKLTNAKAAGATKPKQ